MKEKVLSFSLVLALISGCSSNVRVPEVRGSIGQRNVSSQFFSLEDVKNSAFLVERLNGTGLYNLGSGNVFGNKLYTVAHTLLDNNPKGDIYLRNLNHYLSIDTSSCSINRRLDTAVCSVSVNLKVPPKWQRGLKVEGMAFSSRYRLAQKLPSLEGFRYGGEQVLNLKTRYGESGGVFFAYNSRIGYVPFGNLTGAYTISTQNSKFVTSILRQFGFRSKYIKKPNKVWHNNFMNSK